MKLLIASGNRHKVTEIAKLLQGTTWEVCSLADFPDVELPPEDAPDFAGNARIKAVAASKATGLWVLADDSGLAVDYLNGEPGVRSARYAGEQKDDNANNQKLLAAMQNCSREQRTARFICVLSLVSPTGEEFTAQGVCEGTIGYEERGEFGFGYDPLFVMSDGVHTMAELDMAAKNQVSHRARALAALLPTLLKIAESE
ncbi:MAG TPA: RdgB/HAM1 family non-canonical purine NTP pyrophosphatase [Candidatus Avidehalobacter gallistercoris]|uniref:dITP/XTP pyrophosphatase n=1 Tax=Candidatus Avidehalobacter gallistercoris TaxID=2840694 RepID=A0A9D1HN38_9FIRM|nr:RdgB/HAM1 family non-canonical purine NTP pyrophosphatase [Candidatus Avidehalobacter gallistercoris]